MTELQPKRKKYTYQDLMENPKKTKRILRWLATANHSLPETWVLRIGGQTRKKEEGNYGQYCPDNQRIG